MAANKREELLNLIPAYAIGALDDAERAALESWLEQDPEARALLAEYEAVADHLVALAPLRPAPERLQTDLRQRLAASRTGHPAPIEEPPRPQMRRFSRRPYMWLLAAAAVLVVVLVGVLLSQFGSSDETTPTPNASRLFEQLVAQPGSSRYAVVPGEVQESVSGDLVISSDGRRAVLRVSGLPTIGEDQVFQMWLVDDQGARTSGGLFRARASEEPVYLHVPFDTSVSMYQGVGVSLEPAGGSPYADQPTGPRVLSVPLS